VISRRLKQRASAHALREQIDAAMADFHPPAFEEMIEEGKKLFNSPRMRHARRKSGQSRATAPQDA
jgi:hypothetical protein